MLCTYWYRSFYKSLGLTVMRTASFTLFSKVVCHICNRKLRLRILHEKKNSTGTVRVWSYLCFCYLKTQKTENLKGVRVGSVRAGLILVSAALDFVMTSMVKRNALFQCCSFSKYNFAPCIRIANRLQ
jgi:hypothetical protein